MLIVAGLGLEPRLLVPETSVLPLDDPATQKPPFTMVASVYRVDARFYRNSPYYF